MCSTMPLNKEVVNFREPDIFRFLDGILCLYIFNGT
jgi:hypothetical protein